MNAPLWSHRTETTALRRTISRVKLWFVFHLQRGRNSFRYRVQLTFPLLMLPYYVFYTLLLLTPMAFRREVGREIRNHFYDAMVSIYEEEGRLRLLSFIIYNFWDMLLTAIDIRTEAPRRAFGQLLKKLAEWNERPHFIYYRRGLSSVRIAINKPVVDIRLRISFRAIFIVSMFLATLIVAVCLKVTSNKDSAIIFPGWM